MKRRISRRFQPTLTPGIDQLESRQLLSSGFQVVSSPTIAGSNLTAVSAVSPTDIWAVGSDSTGPLIEEFNGTSWSQVTAPRVSGGSLNGVSALASNDVWAVGKSTSGPLVEFFNGTSWNVQTTPTVPGGGGSFDAVTAISPTDVWAVGGSASGELIENFNGTSWSIVQAPASTAKADLTGISAISSTDIYAVGTAPKADQLLQFNGTTWSAISSTIAGSDATKAVDAISATDVWVVGDSGIWNFNGTSWTQLSTPNVFVNAISGSSSNNVFAVGNTPPAAGDETTFVDQWNGTSFTPVTSANPGNNANSLSGVTTLSNGLIVAVGDTSSSSSTTTTANGLVESATFSVPVTAIATTTALTATPGSLSFGEPVTFTATITPASTGSAAPTGTVAFFSGSTLLGGGTVSNDVATFTTTALPVGTSSITATYGGNSNYDASTSSVDSVTTTQSTTSTAISFSPASPVLGQDVTLTATITPSFTGSAAPTGTVEFFDGSTLLGSGTVSSDVATLATTSLPLGTSSITATYEGDTNYSASTSAAESVTVVQAATPPSGSFQLVTSPTINGSLSAISSLSATDIWAVGFENTSAGGVAPVTENFNGTSWSVVAAPTPAGSSVVEFTGVSAVASNNVWAVGFSLSVVNNENVSTPLIEHYNGTSWSIQTTPATEGKLNAVTDVSATDVWAVGSTGSADLIENFNGTGWSIVQAPSPPTASPSLGGISAVSSTDIFAVGGVGKGNFPQVLQYNGTTWTSLANLPTGIADTAIDAISATDVWTVGDGNIWNFNGTSWTEVAPGLAGDLAAVSGSSANDIFAVGETISTVDETLVEQWNGTNWTTVTSAGSGELTGVTILSNGTAVAVGGVGIESNATTAAPEVRVAVPVSAVASPASGISSPAVSAATAPTSRSVVTRANPGGDDNTRAGVTSQSNGTALVDGTLENDSSTVGTKIKRLFGLI